jgi:uncharacterized protein YjbI with pentapeptide repeats
MLEKAEATRYRTRIRTFLIVSAVPISIFFIVCTVISGILLVRLGWNALAGETSSNQETIKNFLLAFASTFGVPFLIWRTWVAHRQARAALEQARIAAENHITGIFSKSVELMGFVREARSVGTNGIQLSTSVPNIESRLGALYALERLLAESIKDQRAILETLCAYVRENSRLEIPEDEATAQEFFRGNLPPRPTHRADVQAALTIIGRRSEALRLRAKREGWRLDLTNSNLIAYDLSGLNYDYGRFDNSFFNGANMSDASFCNGLFKRNFMRSSKIKHTTFHSAVFDDCDVRGAEIEDGDFSNAILIDIDLREARVISSNVKGANLEKAFDDYLGSVIKYIKESGPSPVNVGELISLNKLFQNLIFDEKTRVSDAVREGLMMMRGKPQSEIA